MAVGLVVYDLLYLLLAGALYGASITAGLRVAAALPMPLAAAAGGLAGVLTLLGLVAVATALLPRLEPGTHRFLKSKVFYSWILRSLLRRVLFIEPLRTVLFNVNVLRFLALRALGARVAFTANASNDVDLLDPSLLEVGPGATLGSRCLISCHYVHEGNLVLGRIRVGPGALVGAQAILAPGVTLGAGVELQVRAQLGPDVIVEEGAVIGAGASLEGGNHVGARARVAKLAWLPRGVRVEPRAQPAPPPSPSQAA
jgi:acetyltransferase-like isoleucine patch superfamily enzyme